MGFSASLRSSSSTAAQADDNPHAHKGQSPHPPRAAGTGFAGAQCRIPALACCRWEPAALHGARQQAGHRKSHKMTSFEVTKTTPTGSDPT